ncbi:LysR family transcriptional regulator [Luteimonas sp. BDR2-5]|uniref:LysR family transcriptional regulator n=1 Tax=Proluteimonas luteida TaxID=2878685 RepID=UPI001E49F22D|nr:LysR substrate-binding domain-containing protein [Luteimonas sp. BDR2-5]MCD9028735.1 LysR family transcriptional regulator [Luteimonas sp. BDR2-5]
MSMDLRQIEYFVRVAELGSFTRASIALGIAQPALSRQVRLLELEAGQPLLLRNGRGVTMTEAGRVMLELGRGVLHQVSRLRDELGRLRGGVAGGVSLGLPPSLSRLLTVPLVRAATRELPGVRLSVSEGLTTAMQESLASGQLDLALLYNLPARPDIDSEYLLEEPLFVVSRYVAGARPHPVAPDALADMPLVIPRRPNAFRTLVEDALARTGRPLRIAMEADGVDAILGLVADGVGSAVLGASAVAASALAGRYAVHPIDGPGFTARIHLATSSQRPTTQAQRAMMALVRTALAESLDPVRRQGLPRLPESWP